VSAKSCEVGWGREGGWRGEEGGGRWEGGRVGGKFFGAEKKLKKSITLGKGGCVFWFIPRMVSTASSSRRMCFWFILKMVSTASSSTRALVAAGSLQLVFWNLFEFSVAEIT
jgi:hypothetical protein